MCFVCLSCLSVVVRGRVLNEWLFLCYVYMFILQRVGLGSVYVCFTLCLFCVIIHILQIILQQKKELHYNIWIFCISNHQESEVAWILVGKCSRHLTSGNLCSVHTAPLRHVNKQSSHGSPLLICLCTRSPTQILSADCSIQNRHVQQQFVFSKRLSNFVLTKTQWLINYTSRPVESQSHLSPRLYPSTAGCSPPSMSFIVPCLLLSCSWLFPTSLPSSTWSSPLISSLTLVAILCSVESLSEKS